MIDKVKASDSVSLYCHVLLPSIQLYDPPEPDGVKVELSFFKSGSMLHTPLKRKNSQILGYLHRAHVVAELSQILGAWHDFSVCTRSGTGAHDTSHGPIRAE